MDQELKAALDEIRLHMATKTDVTAIRQDLADVKRRIDEGFEARKEDENITLREVDALKRRVARLEKRLAGIERTK